MPTEGTQMHRFGEGSMLPNDTVKWINLLVIENAFPTSDLYLSHSRVSFSVLKMDERTHGLLYYDQSSHSTGQSRAAIEKSQLHVW